MNKTKNTYNNFPDWVMRKWQDIADLLAETIDIPAALIMKTENEMMEVFISSQSENNPYQVGTKEKWQGLYCETVIKTQHKLSIQNATKDKVWDKNPDIKLGMIAYLGFPLNFPDNQPFGTLCILDNKERPFTLLNEKLILQFKNVIELDLALMQSFELKTNQLAENVVHESAERIKAEEKIKKLNRVYTILSNINQTILRTNDKEEIFDKVCRIAVDDGEYVMAWVGMINSKTNKVDVVASAGITGEYLKDINIDLNDEIQSSGPTGRAIKSGKSIFSNNIESDDKMIPWRQKALKQGYRSSITLPIFISGKIIGTYTMYSKESGFFNEEEVKLLDEMASNISFALEFIESEKKRELAENELMENNQRLLDAQAIAKVGSWETDLSNMEMKWSEETYRIFELDPNNFHTNHSNFLEYVHPEDRSKVDEAITLSFNTHSLNSIQHRIVTPSGIIKFVEENWQILYNNQGLPIRAFGTCSDVTKRKQAEEAIIESEERFRNIFENSMVGKTLTYLDGSIKTNLAFSEIVGYSKEDLSKLKWQTITHADDIARDEAILQSIITGKKHYCRWEKRYIKKNGDLVWVEICTYLQRDMHGKPMYFITSIIDITDRKKADNKLKESELRYRNLFDKANEGLLLLTMDGKIAELNQSFAQMHGYTVDEMKNMDIKDLDVLGETTFEERTEIMHRILAGEVVRFEVEHYHKKGHSFFMSDTVSLISIAGHQYFLAYHQDITERKLSESILKDIIEKNPMSIQILNMEGYTIQTNSAHTKLFGVHTPDDYSLFKDAQLLEQGLGELFDQIKKGEVVYFPDSYFNVHDVDPSFPDSPVWIKAIGFTLNTNDGIPDRIVLMHENITERKNAEALLNDIIDKNPMSIQIVDNEGITFQVNPAFLKLFGSLPPPNFSIFTDIERKSPELKELISQAKNGEIVHMPDLYYNAHDIVSEAPDIPVWIRALIFPLKDSGGKSERFVFMHENITDRKNAEEKIRAKDIQFRKLSANLPDLIFQFTRRPDGTYFVPIASEGIKNIFGCSPEDVMDDFTPIGRVIYPEDADRVISDIENSAKHLTFFTCEFRVQIPGKEIQWIFSRSTPEKLPDGSITWYGFNADITERKRAEEEIRNSENNYKTLFNENTDGITIFGIRGDDSPSVILDMNEYAASMLGYSWEEMIKMDPKKLEINITREKIEKRVEVLKTKGFLNYETILQHKNGNKVIVEIKTVVINYANQPAVMNIARDITNRKQIEEELIIAKEKAEESEKKYRQIFDNTFDIMAIYEVTEDGRFKVITFNPAEEKLIGNLQNYQNRYIDECIPPELYSIFKQNYDRCIKAEKLIEYEEDVSFMGINKTFDTQLIPLKNSEGRVYRIIVISRDITDIKLLNNQLKNQNEKLQLLNIDLTVSKEKAEESDKLKSAFLSNMAHEIRTPMNGILGFSELLQEPGLSDERQQEYIKIIRKSGKRMLNIINEIVEISKIEAGLIQIDVKDTDINEQIEFIYTFFKPEAEARGLKLLVNNDLSTKQFTIKTDGLKINSIITNLIKNAIKYTDKGLIEFGVSTLRRAQDNSGLAGTLDETLELRFYVKDTGIGIPKERQQAIFERFIQADIADIQARQGAGLGLSIAKAYAEMLGGNIRVESEEGIGSCFYFTLPINVEQEGKYANENNLVSEIAVNKVENLKILIVEDDETSEMLLNINLEMFSKEILKANNGAVAIDICRNNPDIDLIIMDIQMPVLNGYEASRQIREFNKDVIIIGQTAFGLTGDREKSIKAGCNDYIAKPIIKSELLKLLQKYFG